MKITQGQNKNVILEDAKLLFRNFTGAAKDFNTEGDRNFCILLDEKDAATLRDLGWNIKDLKQKDEGAPIESYVEVAVEYRKGRPPRAVMINSKGRIDLGADEIGIFDAIDMDGVDVIINPYPWKVNENRGIKAYLKSIFVTINEDALDLKYMDVPDASDRPQADSEVA